MVNYYKRLIYLLKDCSLAVSWLYFSQSRPDSSVNYSFDIEILSPSKLARLTVVLNSFPTFSIHLILYLFLFSFIPAKWTIELMFGTRMETEIELNYLIANNSKNRLLILNI